MWPGAKRFDLALALVPDPRVDDIFGKHFALKQEFMIALQMSKRLLERRRRFRYVAQLLGIEIVNVFVQRFARVDLVLDAVEDRHQHRREGEVWIARAIRAAIFDALRLWPRRVDGDADRRGAIAR